MKVPEKYVMTPSFQTPVLALLYMRPVSNQMIDLIEVNQSWEDIFEEALSAQKQNGDQDDRFLEWMMDIEDEKFDAEMMERYYYSRLEYDSRRMCADLG